MSGPEQEFFIRELLDGDLARSTIYWPSELIDVDAPAIATRGFVRELRDLMLRASERNLSPEELSELGREHGEKYWHRQLLFGNSTSKLWNYRVLLPEIPSGE